MTDAELISLLAESKVFAVLRAESAESGFRSAEAAIMGGLKVVEVTLATPGSFRVISDLRHRYGDRASIGAGTVINYEQIDRAIKSGAQFISMPHTNVPLVEACRKHRVPALIGALTPTEVAAAWSLGSPVVSVLPVSYFGGPGYIRALVTRITGVRIAAVGGVGPEVIADYFAAGAFAVGVGTRLFTRGDLLNENYAAIAERARALLRLAGVF